MKIRNDFVSNSSSSSFIVAVGDNYDFYKMADDMAKNCVSKVDQYYDYDKKYVDSIYRDNVANLLHCLKNNILMFLGQCKGYEDNYYGYNSLGNVVVNTRIIDYYLYNFKNVLESDGDLKKHIDKVLDTVCKCRSTCFSGSNTYYAKMYSITQQTIDITRRMLELGYELEFDKWEDLDALEKRLKNGERLYRIYLSHGGDGEDCDSIFGLIGWASRFDDGLPIEIIHSECC